MGEENKKPYILYVAEAIYLEIFQIKKQNIDISNLDAIERFMGSKLYEKVSSGIFHDEWFVKLKENVGIKLPHVGFNNVQTNESVLFDGLKQKDFYFVHSYAMESTSGDYEAGITDYKQKFVSVVERENIFGTQFHPEISQKNGLILLDNFFKKC